MERNNFVLDTGITCPRKNNVSDAAWPRNVAEAGNFGFSHVLQQTMSAILKKTILKEISLSWLKSLFFILTFLLFFIMCFFKHYTPQLTHNCCPCHMNYAAFDINLGSLAVKRSKAISEPGIITKAITVDWGRKWVSLFFFFWLFLVCMVLLH